MNALVVGSVCECLNLWCGGNSSQATTTTPKMADEEKNRLNPIPKGGKKVHSRPVKIGFLDVEEGLQRVEWMR